MDWTTQSLPEIKMGIAYGKEALERVENEEGEIHDDWLDLFGIAHEEFNKNDSLELRINNYSEVKQKLKELDSIASRVQSKESIRKKQEVLKNTNAIQKAEDVLSNL